MQKIAPHLWFDKEAKQAANFYVSVFGDNSKAGSITTLQETPSGDTPIVPFELWGFKFMSISAGPLFKFNPSISFMVNFDPAQMANARERIDEVWNKLIDDGSALMPLDQYPFSERYGWVQDKYGVSWQLILTDPQGEERPLIIPSLLFTGEKCGKTEEAINFYVSLFQDGPTTAQDTQAGEIMRYPKGSGPNQEGTVMFADFKLGGVWLAAMDSAQEHLFTFNEAISLMVYCQDQQEIDYFWEKLSAVPEEEQCGWLKDKFGISWQIVPERMDEMMAKGSKEQLGRLTKAFLPMKKIDLAGLEKAFAENG